MPREFICTSAGWASGRTGLSAKSPSGATVIFGQPRNALACFRADPNALRRARSVTRVNTNGGLALISAPFPAFSPVQRKVPAWTGFIAFFSPPTPTDLRRDRSEERRG